MTPTAPPTVTGPVVHGASNATPIGMNGGTTVLVLVCLLVGLALGWSASRVAHGRRGVLRNAYSSFTHASPSSGPAADWPSAGSEGLSGATPRQASHQADDRTLRQPPDRASRRARPTVASPGAAVAVAAPTAGSDAAGDGLEPDGPESRGEVVEVCLAVADRLRGADPRLWKFLHQQLGRIGVEAIVADGELFDAERHDAVGFELTTDPRRHLTVASTERAGYADHGEVLRRPEVVVFREGDAPGREDGRADAL